MLTGVNLNNKTYEELIEDAIAQIPLYSEEWTNFNVSDPGITILQNLTSFQLLQRKYINEVTDGIKRKMLGILGYHACENNGAMVMLECAAEKSYTLPIHSKLWAGDLCFETVSAVDVRPWDIEAIFTEWHGEYKDITYLLKDRDVSMGVSVFGPDSVEGMTLLIILNGLPAADEPLILYAEIQEIVKRNYFTQSQRPALGSVHWQIYTDHGWEDAVEEDLSCGFLKSGVITLDMTNVVPKILTEAPTEGFAIRCVLTKADYDLLPRVKSLTANLFKSVQRDTKAASFAFYGSASIKVESEMMTYGNFYVYCMESEGDEYREYKCYTGFKETGRFYTLDENGIIHFDNQRFGYGPWFGESAVRVCCYDDETVLNRKLGVLYGYENQELDIHLINNIIPSGFCLLCQSLDEQGNEMYSFAMPNAINEEDLCYELIETSGKIVVKSVGIFDSCTLFICDLASTIGKNGNIRPENTFVHNTAAFEETYKNPSPSWGGTSYETTEELREQFALDMKTAKTAVTAKDYEEIVKRTPGLCIHKVKVSVDATKEYVQVAVKPYGDVAYPKLSPYYFSQISKYLDEHRMITTKIQLEQPEYVPVSVQIMVYVKNYYENAKETIEDILRSALDFVKPDDRQFGEIIRYHEIYKSIEELDLVDSIYRLQLNVPVHSDVKKSGSDILLGNRSLCYLGRLSIEINEKRGHF